MSEVLGFRLSPQQAHLWRRGGRSPAFAVQGAWEVDPAFDVGVLRQALARAAARHQALAMVFDLPPGLAQPVQRPGGGEPLRWRRADPGSDLERLAAERAAAVAGDGAPGLDAVLVPREAGASLLLTAAPGRADRRSLEILAAEAAAGCRGAEGAGEAVQYLAYSEWCHALLEDGEGQALRRRWSEAPPSAAVLPLQREVAAETTFAPRRQSAGVAAPVLARAAAALGADPEVLLLAAWMVLLRRVGAAPAVGWVSPGRRFDELAEVVGPFARALPLALPARVSRLGEAVRAVRTAIADAAERQDAFVPADRVWAGERPPVLFEYVAAAEGTDGPLRPLWSRGWCDRFSALLLAREAGGGEIVLELWHDPLAIDEPAAARHLARVLHLLAGLAEAGPEAALDELEIVPEAERQALFATLCAASAPPADPVPLHRRLAERAARAPEVPALAARGRTWTAGELDRWTASLAARLRSAGVGPEERVGVLLERSPEQVVAVLAVLRAGGAYVPLDPADPRLRLDALLAGAAPRAVVTRSGLADRLPAEVPVVLVDGEEDAPAAGDFREPAAVDPDGLAYVLFTSGSTGAPKGVMVSHRGLAGYLDWAATAYGCRPGDRVPLHSPLGFDLSVTSLFLPLLTGGVLELIGGDGALDADLARLAAGGFGLLKLTPGHLDLLRHTAAASGEAAPGRVLVVGGEALHGEQVAELRRRAPGLRIVNEYGPTETVVGCAAHELPPGPAREGPVPIGRPIAGARLYLLDRRQRPVPWGSEGELFIAGPGVARGYLGRPALTAERFLPDPFGGSGARMYRSGDAARLGAEGELEFLGRLDLQVKVRGVRVEPGEVESVLGRHPAVARCAVTARDVGDGQARLVAYVVPAGAEAGEDELDRFLAERLPPAMRPAAIVRLAELPLTRSGKVDRAALPAPEQARRGSAVYVAPRDAVEEALAIAFSRALGVDRVGIEDDFFALGGDSMRSVRAVALARESGIELTVQELFRFPRVAALAGHAREKLAAAGAGGDEALLAEVEALPDHEVERLLRERLGAAEAAE